MVSGGAPAVGCDLATGTTAPSEAQRRWPILDVHDVKQQNTKQRVVSRSRNTQVHDARTKFGNSRFFQTRVHSRSCASTCARLSSVRTCVRSLPFARTYVRTSLVDPAKDRGDEVRPP